MDLNMGNSEETRIKNNIRKRKDYDYGQNVLKRFKCKYGCVICGYNDNPQALQFNHVDPTQKSFLIAQRAHYMTYKNNTKSKRLLKQELAKCEIVCGNCHLILTYENKHYAVQRKER